MRVNRVELGLAAVAAVAALIGGVQTAHAAVVARYPFDSNSTSSADSEPLTTASVITLPTGVFSSGKYRIDSNNTPGTAVSNAGVVTDVTDPATGTFYLAFSVSQTVPLTTMSFTSLNFDISLNGTGISDRFQVRSDANGDNFQTLIPGVFQTLDSTTPSASLSIPLSSFAYLQNSPDATVNFRLYIADSRGTNAAGTYMDNISLNADVNVLPTDPGAPEPATLGLVGVSAVGMLRRRRRA